MFDLIILGAGPGGYETAVRAAHHGLNVVLIESNHVGGTCLNEGCIPTKCLAHSAEVFQEMKHADALGIDGVADATFNLERAVARKNDVVARLSAGVSTLLSSPNITLVNGEAHFTAPRTVEVNGEIYTAPHIIIATGSVTKFLPIEGAHAKCVLTSREILNLTTPPARLGIIGGGVIGLEFASIFAAIGTQVTVVEFCKEVLPNVDKDLAKRLRTAMKKQGITFFTDARVERIEELEGGGANIVYSSKGKEAKVEADTVLMAVGRAANFAALDLDAAGIAHTPRGITVDENMQTNIAGVYAIGDVNGLCPLAHAATFQGRRALANILGRADAINLHRVPSAVFTTPQLATIGKREEDYTVDKPHVYKAFYRANGRALAMAADEGYLKILADDAGHIEGVHILGACAPELLHEAAVLMAKEGTVDDLRNTIHAHPTLSELYLTALD